ncbi:MAG: alpha/beta hydrolase [Paracoccaceae bacterium]
MTCLAGFETGHAQVNGQTIAYAKAGQGPPVLLLHGFPQTHAMWHAIAPRLSQDFTVIAADLRGYGDSSKPKTMQEMSFRPMAADQVALMDYLGFSHFHLIGHDRGARTAHRLALDTPDCLLSLTVMDIVPTQHLLSHLPHTAARSYYHWFFLAQNAPFPETFIAHDPDLYFETSLAGWGPDGLQDFDADALNAYRAAWRLPSTIRSMCNDYRAAIDVDLALDTQDLHQIIDLPSLVLYGRDGVMARDFDVATTWAPRLSNMTSRALPGGHFFPDTHPKDTTDALLEFLSQQS